MEDSNGGSQVKPIELYREGVCMFRDWGKVQLGHSMEVDAKMWRKTGKGSLGADYSKP